MFFSNYQISRNFSSTFTEKKKNRWTPTVQTHVVEELAVQPCPVLLPTHSHFFPCSCPCWKSSPFTGLLGSISAKKPFQCYLAYPVEYHRALPWSDCPTSEARVTSEAACPGVSLVSCVQVAEPLWDPVSSPVRQGYFTYNCWIVVRIEWDNICHVQHNAQSKGINQWSLVVSPIPSVSK